MAEIAIEFLEFLQSVDAPRKREEAFLRSAAASFIANSAVDLYDLVGFEVADLKRGTHLCVNVRVSCCPLVSDCRLCA